MQITLTTGVGAGPTPVAAFDQALLNAGVANYNLIYLSSVIPPNSVIRRARFESPPDEYGHRLYVVIARHDQQQPGRGAWAGVGWTQEEKTGRGLFVEVHGDNRAAVEADIQASLKFMMSERSISYGAVDSEIVGIECRDQPVCALAIAVYKSKGWEDS
ncbi:MAG: pyruvoyl-dependent arginine decarboxylase [Myxococcales bacterium]